MHLEVPLSEATVAVPTRLAPLRLLSLERQAAVPMAAVPTRLVLSLLLERQALALMVARVMQWLT
jgi:hypothetical protein